VMVKILLITLSIISCVVIFLGCYEFNSVVETKEVVINNIL